MRRRSDALQSRSYGTLSLGLLPGCAKKQIQSQTTLILGQTPLQAAKIIHGMQASNPNHITTLGTCVIERIELQKEGNMIPSQEIGRLQESGRHSEESAQGQGGSPGEA